MEVSKNAADIKEKNTEAPMKVKKSNAIKERIAEFSAARQVTVFLDQLREFITHNHISLPIETLSKEENISLEAMIYAFVTTVVMDIKNEDQVVDYCSNLFCPNVKQYRAADMCGDLFLNDVEIKNIKSGKYTLAKSMIRRDELFVDAEPENNGLYYSELSTGYFDEPVSVPVILESDISGYSVTPLYINSVKDMFFHSEGRVLILGLGIGYSLFTAALKGTVKEITVVESDPDLISLFNENTLSQTEGAERIKIVNSDPLEFVKGVEDGEYHNIFVDLWKSDTELIKYLEATEVMKGFKKTKVDFRLEKSFIHRLMYPVFDEIVKGFHESSEKDSEKTFEKTSDNDTSKEGRTEFEINMDYAGKYVADLLKNEEITNVKHIDYFMDKNNILRMIRGI